MRNGTKLGRKLLRAASGKYEGEGKRKMPYTPPLTNMLEKPMSIETLKSLIEEFLRRGTFIHDNEIITSMELPITTKKDGTFMLKYTIKKDQKEFTINHNEK